jgi:AAA+ superfamily predicted ATPase
VPDDTTFAALNTRMREAVERLVAAGRDPDDAMAGFYVAPEHALEYARAVEADGAAPDARLGEAARLLGLDALETSVLGLCAAPELDPRVLKVFGFLHDDVTRKLPSPRAVADLLADGATSAADVVACFAADRPLRREGAIELVDPEDQRPFLDRSIRVAEPLVSFLLGTPVHVARADGRLRRLDAPAHELGRLGTVARLRAVLQEPSPLPVLVAGSDASALLATALGRGLVLADVRDLGDATLAAQARLLCALEGRELAFDGLEELDPEGRTRVRALLAARAERVLICSASPVAAALLGDVAALEVHAPAPSLAERRASWAALSGRADSDEVAAKFRLSTTQIAEAAEIARVEGRALGRDVPAAEDLALGARQASSSRLGELAVRLAPTYTWDDLVLAEQHLKLLHSISAYLRHRDRVLSEWGYERTVARSQGLKVLFAGESGTGKTMAAQVLANDLGLELFRVDLATVVSKWIGETEKNLDRIFDAAEGSNAILFFDEADALFGKRSEVSDSHDRYANVEVSYLLQKMEGYPGAVILATNFKQNLDTAFQRRLDFAIDFPFPEAEDRKRIWRLVLPAEAPVADDVDLDFLATQFKLSGGAIRNCSLAAAFEAADAGEPIGMQQLVRAVAVEYGKQGRLTLESDFERFHSVIRPDRPQAPSEPAPEPEPEREPAPPAERGPRFVRSAIEELGSR